MLPMGNALVNINALNKTVSLFKAIISILVREEKGTIMVG